MLRVAVRCIDLAQDQLLTYQNTAVSPTNTILQASVFIPTYCGWGRHCSVGVATRYGLDGPAIESRCGRDFPHTSKPARGPNQPPIQWVPGLFPGGKAAGAWR